MNMDPGDIVQLIAVTAVTLTGCVAALFLIKALARRRVEGGSPADPALRQQPMDVRAQLEEGEALRARVAELDERLDFAERILAGHREQSQIGRREEIG
jgi:hypothetical protein